MYGAFCDPNKHDAQQNKADDDELNGGQPFVEKEQTVSLFRTGRIYFQLQVE